ncbi:MAG: DNA polymerase III subunit gamma/tau [Pseudomonadota bacterium]
MSDTDSSQNAPTPSQHYTVLARKYRPKDFSDLIGQEAMVQTLRNAFTTGRIAQAYMLTGVRGVGKTTTARILARALNYVFENIDQPTIDITVLGEHCQAIIDSRHVDVLEMDAASHTGVDNIREIIESARYKPVSARYKVYIIDEVHMLSKGAFNALLKTLEEPPEHVKFIFATTEVRKVPVTVLSRCQRFDLRRIGMEQLTAHLQNIAKAEDVTTEDDALGLIARSAEGSVRDALSVLDQAIALGGGAVSAENVRSMLGLADRMRVFELLDAVFQGNTANALEKLDALYQDGVDPLQLLADMAEAVHMMTRLKVTRSQKSSGQNLSEAEHSSALNFAERLSLPLLGRAWQMLLKGLTETETAPQPIAAVEMILIRMAHVADLPPPDEIIRSMQGGQYNGAAQQQTTPQSPSSSPKAHMHVVSGGQGASALYASAPAPQHAPSPAIDLPEQNIELNDFEAVVAYISSKRDLKLKISLEKYARLVSFKPGHIELNIDPTAPANLANDLGQKLTGWTKYRWIVSLSQKQGRKTLAEERQEKHEAELALVNQHPFMQNMFAHFPNAEIQHIDKIEYDTLDDPEMENETEIEE